MIPGGNLICLTPIRARTDEAVAAGGGPKILTHFPTVPQDVHSAPKSGWVLGGVRGQGLGPLAPSPKEQLFQAVAHEPAAHP